MESPTSKLRRVIAAIRVNSWLVAMALVFMAVLAAVLWLTDVFAPRYALTLATGPVGGTYQRLGTDMARVFSHEIDRAEVRAQESEGSAQNMRWIEDGVVDLAFVQADTAPASSARLVGGLYEEVLHIFVRANLDPAPRGIDDFKDLGAISLGPERSGTRELAEALLEHFEVPLDASVARATEIAALKDAFAKDLIDAAFVLSPLGSQVADGLVECECTRLVPITEGDAGESAAGFVALHPSFRARSIPARIYGARPLASVETIGVRALLVARESLDESVARQVTSLLFKRRNELARSIQAPLSLGAYRPTEATLPYHPGAETYYLRERPIFFVQYAEAISLIITVGIGLWSLLSLFVRWSSDLKKERIDTFYFTIGEHAKLPPAERIGALRSLHRKAFDELMGERLAADESFVIFHDYLISEIAAAERAVHSQQVAL